MNNAAASQFVGNDTNYMILTDCGAGTPKLQNNQYIAPGNTKKYYPNGGYFNTKFNASTTPATSWTVTFDNGSGYALVYAIELHI